MNVSCGAEVSDIAIPSMESYKLVPHRGCTFVGYVVQQVPDAPCNPALQGFPEMRAVGGIGRDTVRIDDA